jgi:hypothetical protein
MSAVDSRSRDSGPVHLVDVDEPGAELGVARGFLPLKVAHPLPIRGQLAGNLRESA